MKKRGMPRDFAVAVYKQAMDVLADSGHDVDPLAVLNLCNNHKVTAYDAAYVVLARELDIELISADKQLIAEFPDNVRSIFSFA